MAWKLTTALKLGRVSNLPTVWSNSLAGVALAGANPFNWNMLTLLLAMSLAYIGGMFLNDAYDRKTDAELRPERPIPAKEITAPEVFAAGYTMLAGAVFFSILATIGWGGNIGIATLSAFALCAAIVLYNVWHKDNPLSPLVMGVCRMMVYLCAGFTATNAPLTTLYIGALLLLAYLIGLTYVAKQESIGTVKNLWPLVFLLLPLCFGIYAATGDAQVWPALTLISFWLLYCLYLVHRKQAGDIPKAVVSMIAGISLLDAMLIASVSSLTIAAAAAVAFPLTLLLQRYIAGT